MFEESQMILIFWSKEVQNDAWKNSVALNKGFQYFFFNLSKMFPRTNGRNFSLTKALNNSGVNHHKNFPVVWIKDYIFLTY